MVIILLTLFTVLITCAGTAAAGVDSGVFFSMESVAGAEGEYILSCDGADSGPVGIFATFPGSVTITSTTLPEDQYRLNGNSVVCALIDENACSLQIRCADLQHGSLSLSWDEFASGISGIAEISVSDAGEVSVSSPEDAVPVNSENSSATMVQQSPFGCIVFSVMVSFAAVGVYSRRVEEESR